MKWGRTTSGGASLSPLCLFPHSALATAAHLGSPLFYRQEEAQVFAATPWLALWSPSPCSSPALTGRRLGGIALNLAAAESLQPARAQGFNRSGPRWDWNRRVSSSFRPRQSAPSPPLSWSPLTRLGRLADVLAGLLASSVSASTFLKHVFLPMLARQVRSASIYARAPIKHAGSRRLRLASPEHHMALAIAELPGTRSASLAAHSSTSRTHPSARSSISSLELDHSLQVTTPISQSLKPGSSPLLLTVTTTTLPRSHRSNLLCIQ